MLRKNLLFAAVTVMGLAIGAGCGSPASSVRQTESGVVPQFESSVETQGQDDQGSGAAESGATDTTAAADAADAAGQTAAGQETQAAQSEAAQTQAGQGSAAQGQDAQAQADGTQASATQSGGITEEDAKAAALADAGVSEADVTRIRVKKDRDDGRNIYEVEFYVDQSEYDYDIDAETGTIVSKDFDIENDFYLGSGQNGQNGDVISEDDAIAIVLDRIPGASASDVWIKLDYDDGYTYYEGEVYYDSTEYEFELDAYTGEVLEWSQETHGR